MQRWAGSGGRHSDPAGTTEDPRMTMLRSLQVSSRGLLFALALVVSAATAACGGESALFARDGGGGGATGLGGAGAGGTGAGGTESVDAGPDISSVDGAMDQSSDHAVDGGCSSDNQCTTTQ